MRVDQLDLLRLGHRVGDLARRARTAPATTRTGAPPRAGRGIRARPRRAARRPPRIVGVPRRAAISRAGLGWRQQASPAAGVAQQAVQDARRDHAPVVGGRADVVDRGRARRRASRRRDPPPPASAARPRGRARWRVARIGVAATEPSATRTSSQPCEPRSCQASAMHDLGDRLRAPRADLAEAHLAARAAAGIGPGGSARPARGRSSGMRGRSPSPRSRARRAARRRGSPRRPRAGSAACRRPATRSRCCRRACPRFWICAAPIVAAASTSAGRCSRQSAERRISVYVVRAPSTRAPCSSEIRAARRSGTGRASAPGSARARR